MSETKQKRSRTAGGPQSLTHTVCSRHDEEKETQYGG